MLDRNGGSWNWVDEDGCSESIVRHVARSMSHLYGESFTGDISGVGRIVVPLLNQAYKIGKKSVFGDEVSLQPAHQEKLSEHQIRWVLNALSRLASLAHFLNKLGIPLPKELAHINVTLQGMHKHGTSDGKPYVEPEPPIPEGYRKANVDEWRRTDVMVYSCRTCKWEMRLIQGSKFDPPGGRSVYIVPCRPPVPEGWRVASEDEYHRSDIKAWEGSYDGDRGHWRVRPDHKIGKPFNGPNYLYIVPIDPPLTDQDACVWPRLRVMVRDHESDGWFGPYKYLGKSKHGYAVDPDNSGFSPLWSQARRATPEEIEAAK